jgi:sterol desaturase/sphingolipid hydroxylase (fatty acid hydroxylase superfamily)
VFLAAGYYRPRFRQRLLREGLAADLLHAVVNGVLLDLVLGWLLRSIALGLEPIGAHWLRVLSAAPLWQQGIVLLIAGDLLKWVTHRAQHAIPLLWRLRRLHHSTQELDALSHARSHPWRH